MSIIVDSIVSFADFFFNLLLLSLISIAGSNGSAQVSFYLSVDFFFLHASLLICRCLLVYMSRIIVIGSCNVMSQLTFLFYITVKTYMQSS